MTSLEKNVTIIISLIGLIISLIGLIISMFSIYYSNANNDKIIRSQAEMYSFEKLDHDVSTIQYVYGKNKQNLNQTIEIEDKDKLRNAFEDISIQLDINDTDNSKEYNKVKVTGNQLREACENYIYIFMPELNPNYTTDYKRSFNGFSVRIPRTGSLPNLEYLLREYKKAKREYMMN